MASSSSYPQSLDASSSSPSCNYDVFLSFRGEDTRKTFVDHLYTALKDRQIHVYKDDEALPRGESIAPALFKAIEGSQIAIVIFSKNYANSSWCLEELTHIMKCQRERNLTVMPIFFGVDPSYVRKQKRTFEEAFIKHEIESNDKVESWRKALFDASNFAGWDPQTIENGLVVMAGGRKGTGSRRDPAWKYGVEHAVPAEGEKKGYKYIKCNFCSKVITGGVSRMKDHLGGTHKNVAPCLQVPQEVKDEIKEYLKQAENAKFNSQRNFEETVDAGGYFVGGAGEKGATQQSIFRFMNTEVNDDESPKEEVKMTPATAREQRNMVSLDIGRFFFENGIPFNVSNSPSFINMLRSVGNYGRGLKPPSMYELRTWILQEEVKTTTAIVDDIKATWKTTGVSLLSDGWSDMRNRSLINFLVNNPHGTVFLKTVDASDCIKNADKLFELLDGVIEEIGEDIVVQVVTDNASAYKKAGEMLMEKRKSLYWTPCAAHCIDLMLERIGELPQQKNALIKAKKISNFVYNHQWVLSLARKFLKKDLLRPAATRFATAFLTLESVYELKQPLQQMFVSTEWGNCAWAKKADGKEIKKIIMDERTFWPSVAYSLKTTKPLVEVLRIVDGEQSPAMGFLYGAMDECKEKIAKNFDNDESYYKEIWDIIDDKWDKQMHRDLHAAAYFLNPRFRWSPNVSTHGEIKRGLLNCMDRIVKDNEVYAKIEDQLDDYKYKRGLFGHRASLGSYMSRSPITWWDNYGDDVPELQAFAMRILGLTCSASACERNWSTFNQVHTKRRNRLSTVRMNKLVYIMYNKKLKQKFMKKANRKQEEDPIVADEILSDDEWIADPGCEEVHVSGIGGSNGEEGESSSRKRKRVQIHLVDEDEVEDDGVDDGHNSVDENIEDGAKENSFYNI